ncbi:MAG: GNAT family N-acetyltransferase [Candidatus Heimdallarchaeota archaeon]|nr:MAG: GNAT family N-acetyltransferase [Candidatus Heimdallarchaeota archaeon]
MSSIHIRSLNKTDADFLTYLDSQVKWGFSQKITEIFLEYSDSAYLAEDSVTQQPLGIVLTYYYPPSTGWIGFLIVDEQYQNRGIGRILFLKAVNQLLEIGCKEILLDAVPDVVNFYEKFHFYRLEHSFRLKIPKHTLLRSLTSSPQSIQLESDHLQKVGDFDSQIFGAERNKIFQIMLKNPKSDGAVFIRQKKVEGYGFIRYSKNSFSIGPLIANDSTLALDLISRLIEIGIHHCKECEWILVGVTETSNIPLQFFHHLGFKEYNYSLRMRYGTNQREISISNLIYCITSPAMG